MRALKEQKSKDQAVKTKMQGIILSQFWSDLMKNSAKTKEEGKKVIKAKKTEAK